MRDASEPQTFTVVIPYYQREAGLLSEALESVFCQTVIRDATQLRVVVVDDHSPRDPQLDIELITVPVSVTVEILKTPENGGPAAARNFGLEAVNPDCGLVAFLDSDEVWSPVHLGNARKAIDGSSAGVYFANYRRREWKRDKFSTIGFGEGHTPICSRDDLFSFVGSPLAEILLNATVRIQTCVVRWADLDTLRFREDLKIGEDSAYVADAVALYDCTLAFSSQVETEARRQGVNVSQNLDNDVLKELNIRLEMLRYQRFVVDNYNGCSDVSKASVSALNEARYNYSRALKRRRPGMKALLLSIGQACRTDHGIVAWAFCQVFKIVNAKFTSASR